MKIVRQVVQVAMRHIGNARAAVAAAVESLGDAAAAGWVWAAGESDAACCAGFSLFGSPELCYLCVEAVEIPPIKTNTFHFDSYVIGMVAACGLLGVVFGGIGFYSFWKVSRTVASGSDSPNASPFLNAALLS